MTKLTFKITYRPGSGERVCQSQLIEAHDVNEARKILGPVHSIRSISIQCRGVTKNGDPCQRFSHDEYCQSHMPTDAIHFNFEVRLDLDDGLIVLDKFIGSRHVNSDEFTLLEAMENWNRLANLAKYPRTQMVDRLISFDWDIDELRAHYQREEDERMAQRRREMFRVQIKSRDPKSYDVSTLELAVTRNRFQWHGLDFTDEEAQLVIETLQEFFEKRFSADSVSITNSLTNEGAE